MATKTEISNLALLRIGHTQFLTDVDAQAATSKEAATILAMWDFERQKLLRAFDWPFARKYDGLTLNDGTPEAPINSDWIYEYAYPEDSLKIRRLVTCKGWMNCSPPPFSRGRNSDAERVIYTNLGDAAAEYTVDITNAEEFDELFVSMLAWCLAKGLALGVSRVPGIADVCDKEYEKEKALAESQALQEAEYATPSGDADPAVREIYNLAITRCGMFRNELRADPEFTWAKLWPRICWDIERDFILRDFPWPFATQYAHPDLVAGSQTEPVNGDWTYSFLYPTDCLFLRRLVTGLGRKETIPSKFRVGRGITNPDAEEADQVNGRLIYTNDVTFDSDGNPQIEIEYTLQVTDPSEFDSMFISTAAWRIAAQMGVMKDPKLAAWANQNYELEKQRAQRASLNEAEDEDAPDAEWIRGR